jgi:ubiquinone/menaquinone biosynthesis C-methylase UbiE
LALDYRNSKFTAIDIADLLPIHFNEDVIFSDTNRIFNSLTTFSPTHPDIKEYNDYFQNASHISENDVTGETLNQRKVLNNLDFYQYNILEAGLPFEDNTFDFVMQQLVTAAFTVHDWVRVIREITRVTKPGGYIQLIEIDYHTFNLGPNGQEWETKCKQHFFLKKKKAHTNYFHFI